MTCINNDKPSNEFYYIPITFSKTILQQRKTHDLLGQ